MSFGKLYEYSASLLDAPILLETVICPKVIELTGQDEVFFTPVDLDPNISLGHIKQRRDILTGVYTESKWITEIRFYDQLNECKKRFVCCKELMHVFDSAAEKVDSVEKFHTLLQELESPPLPQDASPMYLSENKTKWMALLILCPLPMRQHFFQPWAEGKMSDYDVALALRIPESLIKNVMSDYYFNALKFFGLPTD